MMGIQLDQGGGGKFEGFKNNFGRFFLFDGGGILPSALICHRPLTLLV